MPQTPLKTTLHLKNSEKWNKHESSIFQQTVVPERRHKVGGFLMEIMIGEHERKALLGRRLKAKLTR